MAQLLCVSVKAVQSYEQGWRNIPSYIERQLLLLISLKKTPNRKIKPCWDLKDCAPEWIVKCIVWELKVMYFCWFLNGTYCQGKTQKNWNDKIKLCRECVIYKDMLADI
ncbi:MAG: helix-turn-helix domain-containing protein [Nitrososphaeraceae archaeon]